MPLYAAPRLRMPFEARGTIGLLGLVRPLNVVMMLAGAAVGGVLAAGTAALAPLQLPLLLAMASAAAIGAAANAINDVYDLEIDLVNRPHRPLPSGAVSVRAARTLWAALSAVGVGLAALISPLHLLLALGSVGLLFAYSARLKGTPFWGNLAVAAVIGLALPFGGLSVEGGHASGAVALGGGFAFGSTLAREIAKDLEDVVGDAVGHARTAPLVYGPAPPAAVACVVALLTAAALPVGPGVGLPPSFLALGLPVAGLLVAAAWVVLGAAAEGEPAERAARAGRASALLKVAMLAGLVALSVAAW